MCQLLLGDVKNKLKNSKNMHPLGKTSLLGFFSGLSIACVPGFFQINSPWTFLKYGVIHSVASQVVTVTAVYFFKKTPSWKLEWKVLLRSCLLGLGFATGQLLVWNEISRQFGSYLSILTFFHYSEFLVTALINPSALSLDSFLLNHSKEYGIAAGGSWLEFAAELYLFPGLKLYEWPMKIGLFFCIAGELLRKGAMLTAWGNFTHLVRERRVESHKLVTHGVYSVCRHPSYAGWFWWSIGTQLVLVNPLCTVGYALASWKFFANRIPYEEATLLSFFGHKYFQYQSQVSRTGIPFLKGYTVEMVQDTGSRRSSARGVRQRQVPIRQYQRFEEDGGSTEESSEEEEAMVGEDGEVMTQQD